MSRLLKRLAMPVLAAALMGFGASANADTVSYYTTGTFSTPAGSGETVTNGAGVNPFTHVADTSSVLSAFGGKLTLAFDSWGTSASPRTSGTLPTLISLATFSVQDDSMTGAFNASDTFTLTINQTAPAGNSPGTTIATSITGTITFTPPPTNTDTGTLTFTFVPAVIPIFVGGQEYDYTLATDPLILGIAPDYSNPAGGQVTLSATVSEAPLPASASMGLTLLAACGVGGLVARLRRNQVLM